MDHEKHGINIGLRKMSDFKIMFYKDHAQCDSLFKTSQISKLNFSG